MNVHLFGKVDSACYCIWATVDDIVIIVSCAEEAIGDNFYMNDYLDSFHTIQKAIKVSIEGGRFPSNEIGIQRLANLKSLTIPRSILDINQFRF